MALNQNGQLDIVINEDGSVERETTLQTAVLTSLLLNRRADPEDPLPYAYRGLNDAVDSDRQGWTGDILDEQGRLVGSKLWLLDQELATEETRSRAIEYIKQALQWTIDDGYAHSINFESNWPDQTRLDLHVSLNLKTGDVLNLRVNYETGAVYVI